MRNSTLRMEKYLVGGYVALWLVLGAIHLTRGISDQDPSLVLVLLVHALSYPVILVLKPLGLADKELLVAALGTVQWALIALMLAGVYRCYAHRTSSPSVSPEAGR